MSVAWFFWGGCEEGSYLEKFLEELEKAWDEEEEKGENSLQ